MFKLSKKFKNHNINCSVIKMGNDLNISIYGGDIPHIGAVALGVARPSLEDIYKTSSSVSLLTITGHKEDIIAQRCARILSSNLDCSVVVACGIHLKDITFDEIQELDTIINRLIDELIISIKNL